MKICVSISVFLIYIYRCVYVCLFAGAYRGVGRKEGNPPPPRSIWHIKFLIQLYQHIFFTFSKRRSKKLSRKRVKFLCLRSSIRKKSQEKNYPPPWIKPESTAFTKVFPTLSLSFIKSLFSTSFFVEESPHNQSNVVYIWPFGTLST